MGDEHRRLGIPEGVDAEAIERAFRRRARVAHPDVDRTPGAGERMRALLEARQRAMEGLLTSGATRRTITVDELLQRIITPTVGHGDQALAEALARLLNADDEAGVWVAEVDQDD